MGSESSPAQGYRGAALELLKKFGATPGKSVRVRTKDGLVAQGILLPRYEDADEKHIVLKLKSGYNIGVDITFIESLETIELPPRERAVQKVELSPDTSHNAAASVNKTELKNVALLSTGGTIASKIDYVTGAVHPALTAADLYSSLPELDSIAKVKPEVVFSVLSENLNTSHWQILAERVKKALEDGAHGAVVMSGTDILGYISAALSFALLGTEKTVVCVGSQRSSDRPSSDSALNLLGAVRFAAQSDLSGVYVAMHENESDDRIAIHKGTRVRKNHTSRRDAFESIDDDLVATVAGNEIAFSERGSGVPETDKEFHLKTHFESATCLLKFYPGFDPNMLEYLASKQKVRGIIFEGTGLGHVSSVVSEKISELTHKGIFVGMTSQCIWGHVDLNVYRTGRDLLQGGVIPLGNMLGETAFVKLSWALGNFPEERTKEIMQRNIAGELSPRITL
jgi:glutamyl-tRNA(Gln) amidotransferase subunit D